MPIRQMVSINRLSFDGGGRMYISSYPKSQLSGSENLDIDSYVVSLCLRVCLRCLTRLLGLQLTHARTSTVDITPPGAKLKTIESSPLWRFVHARERRSRAPTPCPTTIGRRLLQS